MKRGFTETDFFDGTEYMHITKKGEILTGHVTYNKGENYISTEHTCSCGKDTYDTYEKARKALKQRGNQKKEVYKCSICGYWHLTSKDGNTRRKKKFDKRTRNMPTTVNESSMREEKKLKKTLQNRPSYYRIIQNGKKEDKTTRRITISDLCDFNLDALNGKGKE